MELMIIAVDSLDPRILFENIDMFPNMRKIYKEGIHSSYDGYVYGYGSIDNWISIYTGLSPNKHGIIGNINTKTNKIPNYKDYKKYKPFWKILSDNNISSAIWRGIATSPGEEIDGYMITGEHNYGFDESKVKYESMKPLYNHEDKDIDSCFKNKSIGYPTPPKKPIDYGYTWDEIFRNNYVLDEILEDDEYYKDGYMYLEKELKYYKENIINIQKKYPTDLLYYYTPTLDLIQHFQYYDGDRKLVLKSMKLVDNFIGEMREELNPENIMVISDHGMSSFKEVLKSENIETQKESFGWRDKAIWMKNGEIIVKARNGAFLSSIHEIKATFIAAGKDIKSGKLEDMRTLDLYPTILEIFNIDIPKGREGYVLDIFKKKEIINEERLLKETDINYENIALIQNMNVPDFNRVINEVYLDHRFHKITLFCDEKYKSIFKVNPRLSRVESIESVSDKKKLYKDYKHVYSGYKDDISKTIEYKEIKMF